MSSLMNPDHLIDEIKSTKKFIAFAEEEAEALHLEIKKVRKYFYNEEGNNLETIVLTPEQKDDVILLLNQLDRGTYVPAWQEKFYVRVLENLRKDRRWKIGSKLKFLK